MRCLYLVQSEQEDSCFSMLRAFLPIGLDSLALGGRFTVGFSELPTCLSSTNASERSVRPATFGAFDRWSFFCAQLALGGEAGSCAVEIYEVVSERAIGTGESFSGRRVPRRGFSFGNSLDLVGRV